MQGREGNKKHTWKNYQWLSYQALPGAQWEASTLAAALIPLLVILADPFSITAPFSALYEHSFSVQCWMEPDEVEKLKKRISSCSLSCPLSSQQLFRAFLTPSLLHWKGQLEPICFGTQSSAILLGAFGYFTAWLIWFYCRLSQRAR